MSNRKTLIITTLFVSAFSGMIAWKLASYSMYYQIETKFYPPGIGGDYCDPPLYDKHGNFVCNIMWFNEHCDKGKPAYIGQSPLYKFPETLNLQGWDWETCQFPKRIDPNIALTGNTVYPIVFSTSISDTSIKKGESIKIDGTLVVSDAFTEYDYKNNAVILLHVDKGETLYTKLDINSSTFVISPSNSEINYQKLSHNRSQKYTWILSPKTNAVGNQWINIQFKIIEDITKFTGNNTDLDLMIVALDNLEIDVKEIFGVNPSIAAFLSAIASAIITFLTILKLMPEAWGSLSVLRRSSNKKRDNNANSADAKSRTAD